MGLLFEAIEAEEAEVRGRVEQLEARLAEVTELLEAGGSGADEPAGETPPTVAPGRVSRSGT
ncbi:hypothetical protein [Streptomyces sp. CL12-4]|uniref:hypothetical protein n=1 Tax=Streptomyces sp. CL12-4 TaxID=2810306 RepID=UPI001EFA2F77|nr:hypothetical protein [Streptomyces sp. CL12-4]MCG8971458.1 hypothetical protein [Streptomyces sp. CL12-4]